MVDKTLSKCFTYPTQFFPRTDQESSCTNSVTPNMMALRSTEMLEHLSTIRNENPNQNRRLIQYLENLVTSIKSLIFTYLLKEYSPTGFVLDEHLVLCEVLVKSVHFRRDWVFKGLSYSLHKFGGMIRRRRMRKMRHKANVGERDMFTTLW